MKIFILIIMLSLPAFNAYAQRYALVIGNSQYSGDIGALKNPVNDAMDMAALLKKKQFIVTVLKNATKRQMKQGIRSFNQQLNQKDAVGLFFFAGHGVEVGGRNYLIPVNANIEAEADVEFEGIDAGWIMRGMEYAGNNLNMLILDACRNNPFARSFRSASRGLAGMIPPKGSLILYATSPGEVASDGNGRNGLFTQHLMQAIDQANITVEKAFKTTAINVYNATAKKQLPWQQGVILGDFYFSRTMAGDELNKTGIAKPLVALPELVDKDISIGMINIKGGCYQMGSPSWDASRDNDEKQHQTCIKDFQISKKEVTVAEFRKFVRATDYRTQAEQDVEKKGCFSYSRNENKWAWRVGYYWNNVGFSQNSQHPVVCVSWIDTQHYITWLNENSSGGYRLPTEAEWEYTARAGAPTVYLWGNKVDSQACDYANVDDKNWSNKFPCDDAYKYTAPVGSYRANAFGLYDMLGNVWEWTCSQYSQSYSGGEQQCIKQGSDNSGSFLVLRGGSFDSGPQGLRMAGRGRVEPWARGVYGGFRLVREH